MRSLCLPACGQRRTAWLAGLGLLLWAGAASATTFSFNGSAVSGCSYVSGTKTYTCATLPLSNWNDSVVIASGYTVNVTSDVTFGYNQGLTMTGTAALVVTGDLDIGSINGSLLNISGGSLTASGTVTVGTVIQTIGASISGGAVVLGSGSILSLTGSVTSSGPVTIASYATINGAISGTVITTNSPTVINGSVTASVSFTLASGSTVNGNVTAPIVNVNAALSTINGNVTASDSVVVGSYGTINGNVVTGTLTLEATLTNVYGDVTADSVVLGYFDRVTGTIYCRAPVSSAECSCVTNNSFLPIGSVFGPTCTNIGSGGNTGTCTSAGSLTFTVPNHYAEAVQTISISALKKASSGSGCVAAFASTTKAITFACTNDNPSSGTLPVRMSKDASTYVALASSLTSACSTSSGTALSLSFNSSGVATAYLKYADVGKMTLTASYKDSSLNMTGSSDFVVAPSAFVISNIKNASGVANPKTATVGGTVFTNAGKAFLATITAVNTANTATPNFGQETTAESVALSPTLVAPVATSSNGVVNGTLTGTPTFSSGVANITDMSWSEVGSMKFTAALANSYGYLGASGASLLAPASATSDTIGRFVPSYFNTVITVVGGVPLSCASKMSCTALSSYFAYSKQPFTVTVSARNANGALTNNYTPVNAAGVASQAVSDSYAHAVTLSAVDGVGGSALSNSDTFNVGTTSGAPTVAYSDFSNGVATIAPKYTFATTPTKPTNVFVRATEASADGITSLRSTASDSVEGGLMIVSGRLLVANNYGSELLSMPIRVTAQYWSGSQYLTSNTDSNSNFPTSAVTFSTCKKNLASTSTSNGCKAVVAVLDASATVTLAYGLGSFRLQAPGSGNTGSADVGVTLSILPYLPAATGRAVFGIYRSPVIFIREVY